MEKLLVAIPSLIAIFALYRAAYYWWRVRQLNQIWEAYNLYTSTLVSNRDGKTRDPLPDLHGRIPLLKELMSEAGVNDHIETTMKPVGFGNIMPVQYSYFENIHTDNRAIQDFLRMRVKEARGIFMRKVSDSYNPFYWVKVIATLPSQVLQYVGFKEEGKWHKLFNVVGWVTGVLGFLFAFPEFDDIKQKIGGVLGLLKSHLASLF